MVLRYSSGASIWRAVTMSGRIVACVFTMVVCSSSADAGDNLVSEVVLRETIEVIGIESAAKIPTQKGSDGLSLAGVANG